MNRSDIGEQDQASMEGPRAMKEEGSPLWCWQTVSALQTMWKSLDLDLDRYLRTWSDAEEHSIWEKIPYDKPYGTKEAMLADLKLGDDARARARTAVQSMPVRPAMKHGGTRKEGEQVPGRALARPNGREALKRRIARDRPDIWERMKRGEFTSVAGAAREAGIEIRNPKRIVVNGEKEKLAHTLKGIFGPEEFKRFAEVVTRIASEDATEAQDG